MLKTLETMGPLHGFGIARRIEQVSENLLHLNQGSVYPALLRLEQKGWIKTEWGVSDNNRRAKFYSLTRSGNRQLQSEVENWERTAALVARFLQASARASVRFSKAKRFPSAASRPPPIRCCGRYGSSGRGWESCIARSAPG